MINVPSQAASQSQPSGMTSHNSLEKPCLCECVCVCHQLYIFPLNQSISKKGQRRTHCYFYHGDSEATHNHRPPVVETVDRSDAFFFSSMMDQLIWMSSKVAVNLSKHVAEHTNNSFQVGPNLPSRAITQRRQLWWLWLLEIWCILMMWLNILTHHRWGCSIHIKASPCMPFLSLFESSGM